MANQRPSRLVLKILLITGFGLATVPSLVLPSDEWTADEFITVRIGEEFTPDAGRYTILDGSEARTALNAFEASGQDWYSNDRRIVLMAASDATPNYDGHGPQVEINHTRPPPIEDPLLIGEFGIFQSAPIEFLLEEANTAVLTDDSEVDFVLDIRKQANDRLADRARLAVAGLGLLLLAAVLAIARRRSDPRSRD